MTMEKLKVKAIWQELDFEGRIVETVKECEIEWEGLPPEASLCSVIKSGEYENWPRPTRSYYDEFMQKEFKVSYEEGHWAVLVESEPQLSGNVKFVFKDRFDRRWGNGGYWKTV